MSILTIHRVIVHFDDATMDGLDINRLFDRMFHATSEEAPTAHAESCSYGPWFRADCESRDEAETLNSMFRAMVKTAGS